MAANGNSTGDLIFTIKTKNPHKNTVETDYLESSDSAAMDDDNGFEEIKILSVVWKNGKLGASYFSLNEKIVYVYEELIDLAPHFFFTRALYRQVGPKFVLTFGHIADDIVKTLIDLINPPEEDSITTADSHRQLPPNLFLLPHKEYSYESCKATLSCMTLSTNSVSSDMDAEADREFLISSLVNFDDKHSVCAIGALVKYLDKNWASFVKSRDDLVFLHIHQISLKGHVLMDWSTTNALHVFHESPHDSGFKRGLQSSSREGMSIFKLFSQDCKSNLGLNSLKNMLLNPLNDKKELEKRLDFISFVLKNIRSDFIESLQDNIKNSIEINTILFKLQNSTASARDWYNLYKTVYHSIFMKDLSAPFRDLCEIFVDLDNSITDEIVALEASYSSTIDFTKVTGGRPVLKLGVDETLDAKKLRQQDIVKHVAAAAQVAVEQLPDFLEECAILYLPEMGHLVAIKEWESDCNPDQLQDLGFQYMFKLKGTIHYKNPLCQELDESLGDLNGEIKSHENRILQRLASYTLRYNAPIRRVLDVVGQIDALISMAKTIYQNNYVRPKLNQNSLHEIVECRHPLMELVARFQPNDFFSGRNHTRIKIITGPNGSGKSVFLKQVAITIYLAHVGSYVPAKSANVGLMHTILTRMHTKESASMRLSSFMIDIIQATQALHTTTSSTLFLIDEFGRGTTGSEGFSFLVGMLTDFFRRGDRCPHVLVSTHYQKISNHLPECRLVDHLQMEHKSDDNGLSFLFKVVRGVSRSYAFEVARSVGLESDLVARAKQIFECLSNNVPIPPLPSCSRYPQIQPSNLASFLGQIETPDLKSSEKSEEQSSK